MVGQILPNNNEKCYSNFSPKFSQLTTALVLLAVQALSARAAAEKQWWWLTGCGRPG
jgi:hypothetical protein